MKFDEAYWSKVIQKPDWYMEFVPYAKKAEDELGKDAPEIKKLRRTVRQFFEKALDNGRLTLADNGPNLDTQRLPIDTIVIHHTSSQPGYSLSFMNITHLLNIYAPYYMNPTIREERDLEGSAIWSGHFRDGKPSFLAYHWLMRMDGKFERLLEDKQLGWHAGNWEINRRSVAICLDNDYEKMCPTDTTLKQLAAHIKKRYPKVKKIIGHCEARQGTTCPGMHFVDEWKPKLLEYLAN